MNQSTLYILCISLVLVLMISYRNEFFASVEQFDCITCGRNNWNIGPKKCLSCSSCGWCVDRNSIGRCKMARRDGSGPLFSADCVRWYNGSDYPLYYHYYPWYNPIRWYPRRMFRRRRWIPRRHWFPRRWLPRRFY